MKTPQRRSPPSARSSERSGPSRSFASLPLAGNGERTTGSYRQLGHSFARLPPPRQEPSQVLRPVMQLGGSGSKIEPPAANPVEVTVLGRAGERIEIFDIGGRLSAELEGVEVGYLTYTLDNDGPAPRLRCGYIQTQRAGRRKKLSQLLFYLLALKAVHSGIEVICVGHPDPGLRGYWEAIGFDYADAQRAQFAIDLEMYGADRIKESGKTADDTIVTEADAPVGSVLDWGTGFRSYWQQLD